MHFNSKSYALAYYKRIEAAPYPRLKAWEFLWEYVWTFDGNWKALTSAKNIEITALHLGFYLANWGMYRGSSQLLKNSNLDLLKDLVKLLFSGSAPQLYELSLSDFYPSVEASQLKRNQALLDAVVASIKAFQGTEISWTNTLVTKILLGIWGEYPALDRFFNAGRVDRYPHVSSMREVSGKGLTALAGIVEKNKLKFPELRTQKSQLSYPAGRLLDMALFELGFQLEQEKARQKGQSISTVND